MSGVASIVLGIVSGVIATLLFQGLAQIMKRVCIPWYRSVTYQGLDISGHCPGRC